MSASFALIGLAVAAAGAVGVFLPEGDRIAAVLPLVAGAGIGILALALGANDPIDRPEDLERLFLLGSVLGFVTTIGTLALLWRHTEPGSPGRRTRGSDTDL